VVLPSLGLQLKRRLFEELQDCLDCVPQDDTLGDFNAHVDVYDDDYDELWTGVLRHWNM